MNLGEEFSISQGKEFQFIGSWTPVTPQKPIPPGSNPIQMNEHGNQFGQENWQEFAGFPKGYFQDILNNNEVTQNFNQDRHFGSLNLPKNNRMINNIAGSYRQVLQNGSTEWRNHTWESLLTTGNATNGFASANQTASIGSRNTVSIPNLHSREDSWRHSSSHQSSSSDFISNINNFLQSHNVSC
ncbi:uncharacterized protein LOC120153735 [Hibiscus syriacus]|uniref:uncharacterized protein LOC120153735 n=1 Tax=Hibiscus syriacus TaxID=106335 RepID=UPI00192083E5|nr:uncharacterized protein LOC120153735 [Hibiscus syriacus]